MQARIFDALRRGANTEALSLARLAVAEAPHDAIAHALLAHAARANGDLAGAQSAIARAVLLAPDDAGLHFQRAGFLIGDRKFSEAEAALARSLDLDPNQFDAYIAQAQIALGRGDLEEAERLQRMATRVAPDHAWTKTIAGTIASFRGDGVRAQTLLTQAAVQAPDDPQVLYALGFAHLKQGHLGFAEQALRKVVELAPNMQALRGLIADLLLQQDRPEEAREVLQPLLDDPNTATPALKRMSAELAWRLGRHDEAVDLLRNAFRSDPHDGRTAELLINLWRNRGDVDDARQTLDAVLADVPQHYTLWQIRLGFEAESNEAAQAVINRWLTAMPEQIDALEAQMHLYEAQERRTDAEALALRITELEPGRSSGELRVLEQLMRDDPEAAVLRVQSLISLAKDEDAKRSLLPWLGYAQDRVGKHADAVLNWNAANQAQAAERWPLMPASGVTAPWPPPATPVPGTPPVAYLCGLPGSGVERIAAVIAHAGYPLRADRLSPQPPQDPLQNPDNFAALARGELAPETLLAQWRAALPARGVHDGTVIDWLPLWDNALLKMTRALQPEAILLFAIRDPRDMLLDWLAFGGAVPYGIPSATQAAAWIAQQLRQIVELHRDGLHPHHLLRTDHALADPQAFAIEIGGALGLEQIIVPPPQVLGPPRFAFGHWREYAKPLAEPFALLSDVAQHLGYPER